MLSLTPWLVRRALLPASYLVFLVGILASGAIFYHGRPFDAKAAILSDLQSPDDNPRGYGASAAATAISAILLVPAVTVFYRRLRLGRPKLAVTGVVMFAAGLASAIAGGILAPFTHGYTPLHVQLASAAFIGISAGTWLHLLAARAARALLIFQSGALRLLIFLCYGPVNFNNDRLFTSLAFWEWVLCVDCGLALWALAGRIESKASVKVWDSGTFATPRRRSRAQIKPWKPLLRRQSIVREQALVIRRPGAGVCRRARGSVDPFCRNQQPEARGCELVSGSGPRLWNVGGKG